MTDLNANALEQDVDDDADVVDSWMLYLRAPALTLDASQVLQSLVQTKIQGVHYRKPVVSLDWLDWFLKDTYHITSITHIAKTKKIEMWLCDFEILFTEF